MPDAPAMEVISPYRKPPYSAAESISSEPELAGAGVDLCFERAASRSADANCAGAASPAPYVISDMGFFNGLAGNIRNEDEDKHILCAVEYSSFKDAYMLSR